MICSSAKSRLLVFSQYYTRFKSYCCEAYNILRKSSSLILNLFNLMRRSNIPDITNEENAGLKVLKPFSRLEPMSFYKDHSNRNDHIFIIMS